MDNSVPDQNPNGKGRPDLIPQPHGGALMPPMVKGETRNPWGKPTKRRQMARELIKAAGLDELVELAFQTKRKKGEIAKALVDAACDPDHKGQVAAQRLLRDVLGQTQTMQDVVKHELAVHVQYGRKVRVMDVEGEDAEFKALPGGNGNGHTNGGVT